MQHKKQLHLFPTVALLAFLETDIPDSLPRDEIRQPTPNCLDIPLYKADRAISFATVAMLSASVVLVDNYANTYSIRMYLLTDDGLQLDSKSLTAVTVHLHIKHLTTT